MRLRAWLRPVALLGATALGIFFYHSGPGQACGPDLDTGDCLAKPEEILGERLRFDFLDGIKDLIASLKEKGVKLRSDRSRLEDYLRMGVLGRNHAPMSCCYAARDLLKNPDERKLQEVMEQPGPRAALILYAVCNSFEREEDLLRFVDKFDKIVLAPDDFIGADLLALACYRFARYERCEALLARSPESPLCRWLKAKCAFRKGDLPSAEATYRELLGQDSKNFERGAWKALVCPSLPEGSSRTHVINSDPNLEYALLLLSQEKYPEALLHFLLAREGYASAYVAERVLTCDELLKFCREQGIQGQENPPEKEWTPPPTPSVDSNGFAEPFRVHERELWEGIEVAQLRRDTAAILARRLVREKRYDEALPFFPPTLQKSLHEYVDNLKLGHDTQKSATERVEALWKAALICRMEGMELMGTWLGPDGGIYDGDYAVPKLEREDTWTSGGETHHRPFVSDNEMSRVKTHEASPIFRFHYRILAADLAWEACALMPAGPELGLRLNLAGRWVDTCTGAAAADRYYKTLVKRCRNLPIGRVANQNRWFLSDEQLQNLAQLDPGDLRWKKRLIKVGILLGLLILAGILARFIWKHRINA